MTATCTLEGYGERRFPLAIFGERDLDLDFENADVQGVAVITTEVWEGEKTTYYEFPNITATYISPNGSSAASLPDAQPASTAPALTAVPTASAVLVNGQSIAFDAYTINGNNYFKLRDLACVLSGTEKQFEVSWDGSANAIVLTSGQAYTTVGGELAGAGAQTQTPTLNQSKVFLNGEKIALTAYTIQGNNYFKLRDLGSVLDFGVDWDGSTNTILIDTTKEYTPG